MMANELKRTGAVSQRTDNTVWINRVRCKEAVVDCRYRDVGL